MYQLPHHTNDIGLNEGSKPYAHCTFSEVSVPIYGPCHRYKDGGGPSNEMLC